MYVGVSNILQPLLMPFVNSFRISQLYTSYTLVVVFCIKSNLHGCIVSCYTASVNILYNYTLIFTMVSSSYFSLYVKCVFAVVL
jgi:hypothetical protein